MPPRRWWWGWRGAAAAMLVGALLGSLILREGEADSVEPVQPLIEEVAMSEVGSLFGCGMATDWSVTVHQQQQDPSCVLLCSPADFGSVTEKTLGCAVSVAASCHPSLPVADQLQPKMLSFTVRRGEDMVLVYLLPLADDTVPTLPASNLRCWRRALGPVVAYEVSRLPEPFVLPILGLAQ